MSDFKDILESITDIKKEMHDKNVELKQLKEQFKERQVSLNEELEMCQTKISWLQEDIEDIVCGYFDNVEYVKTHFDHIEIKFKIDSSINLGSIETFSKIIDKDLKSFNIFPYNDRFFLRIML